MGKRGVHDVMSTTIEKNPRSVTWSTIQRRICKTWVTCIHIFYLYLWCAYANHSRYKLICMARWALDSHTPGRRHGIFVGGGTDSWAPKPIYPQNLDSPRISATLFWECWKMQNFDTCREKSSKILISGGRSTAPSPPPPRFRRPWPYLYLRMTTCSCLILSRRC